MRDASVLGVSCDHTVGCITCGDEAVAMRVIRLAPEVGLVVCADSAGREEVVEVALVDRAVPGDFLLVHAATALQRLDHDTTEAVTR